MHKLQRRPLHIILKIILVHLGVVEERTNKPSVDRVEGAE